MFAQPNETDGYDVFNEADAKEYIPIGMELEIDGRKFVIDSVNFSTDEVSPVSYTHLDVYKRQEHHHPRRYE